MPNPQIQSVIAFIKRKYPLPKVNPAWVEKCADALVEAGTEASIDNIHAEYLYSDLSLCTLESVVFPVGELHNIVVFGQPTLLQIHSISEAGASAFQIQTTMELRSEVLSGQTRIRGLYDEDEEMREGKVPPYPRSMLRLEVGDGRRKMRAMEYKRLPDLVLGQTSLGSKIVVQNVRVLRDILLLTPENTRVIMDSCVDNLESLQKERFLRDLKRRLGKLDPEDDEERDNIKAPPFIPPPIKGGQRRNVRKLPNRQPAFTAAAAAGVKAPSQRAAASVRRASLSSKVTASLSNHATAYEATDIDESMDKFDEEFDESFLKQLEEAESRAIAASAAKKADDHDASFQSDDDVIILDESMIRRLDKIETQAQSKVEDESKNNSGHGDLDDFELDDNFFRQIDAAEAMGLASVAQSSNLQPPHQGKQTSLINSSTTRGKRVLRKNEHPEVIEISD
ncbi:uncharacterized protein L203_101473 [Cryptococcus depauperatus CBS 7841]|uniref:RecQ-mediated genome instability protein 1 n=1 Tax=Cryptococcus depauperatus CBS 7841 TaxID=1295531 RepID=A0A1E3ITH4_9TREE|nr:hypothetical protein L203_01168 [Cryptococcus depauperatus CBS 7841]